jgi:hypothetical protein
MGHVNREKRATNILRHAVDLTKRNGDGDASVF